MKIDVTVVFLTWNRRYMINHVLHNLFKNDFPFKTVIVDNASTDGTREYLLEHKDEIDELILKTINVGCVALNEAIRRAEGDYISIQADDHILSSNYLESMYHAIKTIEKEKNVGYVSSILHYALPRKWYKTPMTYEEWMNNPEIQINKWEETSEKKSITHTHKFDDVIFQEAKHIGSGGTIIPKRTFERIGLFRSYGLRGVYDGEFKLRCLTYGLSVGYTPCTAFLHVKEHFTNPKRYKAGIASLTEPKALAQLKKDMEENRKAAQRNVPPPSVPILRE